MTASQLPKILVLIKGLNLGGAERLLVDALPYLDRRVFDYHFGYLNPTFDFLVPKFQAGGFPVHCLGMKSNYLFPVAFPRLESLVREHQFDLIHAHLPMPGILARLVGSLHDIPIVYTEHNLIDWQHPVTRWANQKTYGWNTHVFAVSRRVYESITQFGLDKKTSVVTTLNGVPVEQVRAEARNLDELRQELGILSDSLVVGTVAVMSPQKRLHDWLAAARRVADRRQDVTFVLAGYGPEETALRDQVETLGLTDRVRMPGFRPDGRRVLGLVDVYLMSSGYEGLPIALLEAMSLAKPVVSTAVGGIPEVITDGKEGFLTPVGAIDELAARTGELLDNPALRLTMGQLGSQRVETEFHLQTRIKVVEDTYRAVLADRRSADGR